MKKVMVAGTFDLLHPGHVHFFKQAKKYGDWLVVVVARDRNVKKIKGHLPKHKERVRLQHVAAVATVNQVLLGGQGSIFAIIKKVRPQVICLGYDQRITVSQLQQELKRLAMKVKVVRLRPYKAKQYKSSLMKNYAVRKN
ncbi:FAD synthase [Candidatus Falkowbacteria bacterium]|nr:FAD synthase [Candidatus Falkowbacteria bacterium]